MSKAVVGMSGFSFGPKSVGEKCKVITLSEVEVLVKEYTSIRTSHVTMDFVKRLTRIGRTLLGENVTSHLSSIYENRGLVTESDYNYDFLQDTIKFIETGTRPMSISARVQLMEFHGDDDKVRHYPLKSFSFDRAKSVRSHSAPGKTGESVYTRWLNQPNGLNDMLCTVIVLFGNHNQLCCNK